MTDLPKKTNEFRIIVERIERILKYEVTYQRDLPRQYASNVAGLTIGDSSWGRPNPDAVNAAKAVKEAALNAETLRGEKERDAGLRELAAELESLRAVLPGLAASASIEIGEVARAMKEEAG